MFVGKPPFDLIQLSTLPEETWKGRAVFHPMEQRGTEAIWRITDEDRAIAEELGQPIPPEEDTKYDAGVVVDWEIDPDFAQYGVVRVRFVMSDGSSLCYASYWLWTPRLSFDGV